MSRVGVFICHCGHNIAGTIDVAGVAEAMRQEADVVYASDYRYMCSEPGQELIRKAIAEHRLDAMVVAACSPAMHETTFRKTAGSAGLNPYRCECANIREQASWVHQQQKDAATFKAIATARSMVEKAGRNESLEPLHLPLERRCLVIGAGIAGLRTALDVADAGYPVILVERTDHLGGRMAELSGTYLNLQDGPTLLNDTLEAVEHHPQIHVLRQAQVGEVSGYVGNFRVKIQASVPESSQPEEFEFEVGAIVAATGWRPYPLERLPEYGGGQLLDVVDAFTFEGMLAQGGVPRRPSDGRVPENVVFIQCAGSRDREHGVPYCSKTCCMVVAKQAIAYRQRVPGGQASVFYIDLRSAGRGYEEYVQTAMGREHVLYLRGKVSRVFEQDGRVIVWGADTLSGKAVEIAADLVVLATPMLASEDSVQLGQTLRIAVDAHGFYQEAHPKLRPVETLTAGVFLAGTSQGPRDIPETVAQAGAAAAKVLQLFSQPDMTQSPTVATVDAQLCAGCGACVASCPYGARQLHPVWHIATVNAALCQSCGACVVTCPNKACSVRNWAPSQVLAMLEALM
jgi:heterodisulfide reductase subunit A